MQRQPLGEAADRQKIQVLLKGGNPGWMQTRLCALKMGFSASNTKAFIAESLGVSERTVARWFTVYRQHGLDAVLKRGYGIGRPSGLNSEIEAYLLKGLENARWNTAEQARAELSLHSNRSFSYHQAWPLVKKMRRGISSPSPRARKKGL